MNPVNGSVPLELLVVAAVLAVVAVVGSDVVVVPPLAPEVLDELGEGGWEGVLGGVEGCDVVALPVVLENGSQYCVWLAEPEPHAASTCAGTASANAPPIATQIRISRQDRTARVLQDLPLFASGDPRPRARKCTFCRIYCMPRRRRHCRDGSC